MVLEESLKSQALQLGFSLVGIAPAGPADDFEHLQQWLASGFAGSMEYMSRHEAARRHPESILPEVRSVVMVGLEYGTRGIVLKPPEAPSSAAKVARYARGPNYHDILRGRLRELLNWVQEQKPGCRGRGVVDTAPLLERDFARRAGLGWIGKNTMLINKRLGSYMFLGALLLDCVLTPDAPHRGFHCGTCTACLDACPTAAFPAPGQLDARKCISYLTIEHRGPIDESLRTEVGDWIFGCDVCQEVCPWNRHEMSQPEMVDAVALLGITDDEFRHRFGGTAIERTRRRGLARNAAIVVGNTGGTEALPALRHALDDVDEVVREAAAWAIDQIQSRQAPA